MKLIVMLSLGTLLSVFAWIVAKEQLRTQNIAATIQQSTYTNCSHTAIVTAYKSRSYGSICAFFLEVDNGELINPVDLPENFLLTEGEKITVDYKIIDKAGTTIDCAVTPGPVMAARILCINKIKETK